MDRESHLAKAVACERFLGSLDRLDSAARPWIVTALFYAALHYVDAFLAQQGYAAITERHEERRRLIRQFQATRNVDHAYRRLEQLSWIARYDAVTVTLDDLRRAEEFFQVVKRAMVAAVGRSRMPDST